MSHPDNGGNRDPAWYPVPPEMCGQCASGEFAETWRNADDTNVLIEFTCQGCGYIVSKFGHNPYAEVANVN